MRHALAACAIRAAQSSPIGGYTTLNKGGERGNDPHFMVKAASRLCGVINVLNYVIPREA